MTVRFAQKIKTKQKRKKRKGHLHLQWDAIRWQPSFSLYRRVPFAGAHVHIFVLRKRM